MSTLRALKTLLRDLVYLPHPPWIGRTITVCDHESLATTLAAALAFSFEHQLVSPDRIHFIAALAKYGLIDVELTAPVDLLASGEGPRGAKLLRQLFIAGHPPENPDDVDPDDVEFWLGAIAEKIITDRSYIKLMLRSEPADRRNALAWIQACTLPAGYLPRTFEIEDACVTNCSMVWLLKHFYL